MNLLARGTRPLRVLERQGHLAYPAGVVEFVRRPRPNQSTPTLLRAAHDAYGELVQPATDREPEPEELRDLYAYAMAATVDFGVEAKQGLLDLRSENARLRLVARLFRAAIKRWTSSTGPRLAPVPTARSARLSLRQGGARHGPAPPARRTAPPARARACCFRPYRQRTACRAGA